MTVRLKASLLLACSFICLAPDGIAQQIKLVRVTAKTVDRTTQLPGEFYPYLSVQVHAKVAGFVEKVLVDRGSFVKAGDLLVQLSAPEMMAHIAEAQAQVTSAESEVSQAQAQAAAAQNTLVKLKEASNTPGAVAENDIFQAQQQSDAAQAVVAARKRTIEALQSNLKAQQELAAYLHVSAPFDGVITTRYVHPGALVGPDVPLLDVQQVSRLRLTVAVPENLVSAISKGRSVSFKVSAYPDRTFSGVIARPAHALDVKTRTMAVELDVHNPQNLLAPGMYPSVLWPVDQPKSALMVPSTSIVTTTERVFVIRNSSGHAEWVNIRLSPTNGDLVEVMGDLKPGDEIVERATDEIREGSALNTKR